MSASLRHIIPVEKCIVVIDTNVARGIGESTDRPAWVDTFSRMASSGEYSFSLADGTLAELLNQITKPDGGMDDQCFTRMIQGLETFLDAEYPIILGKRDLKGMLGVVREEPWCAIEAKSLSTLTWKKLCDIRSEPQNAQYRSMIEETLQEERDEWIAVFSKFDSHHARDIDALERHIAELSTLGSDTSLSASNSLAELQQELHELNNLNELGGMVLNDALADLDANCSLTGIPMSARCDLQMRYLYRQWVRTKKTKCAYSPTSRKKRNDGIDFDLYRYLMLPALVLTEDTAFLAGILDIPSSQKNWFMTPQELANSWQQGEQPWPTWA